MYFLPQSKKMNVWDFCTFVKKKKNESIQGKDEKDKPPNSNDLWVLEW